MVTEPLPIVEVRGASITFPGVKALDEVDFRLLPGEVHTLMGENGAGKSTLIKALTGVYQIDSGSILVFGEERRFSGTASAQAAEGAAARAEQAQTRRDGILDAALKDGARPFHREGLTRLTVRDGDGLAQATLFVRHITAPDGQRTVCVALFGADGLPVEPKVDRY